MEVFTIATSPRVLATVKTLTELLITDRLRSGERGLQAEENELEKLAQRLGLTGSRFPKSPEDRGKDDSSLIIAVNHNACILCDRCIRACNEIRNNQVIGRMGKGHLARIAFDLDDPMGRSTCVACGECMVSCPTGALTNRAVVSTSLVAKRSPSAEAVAPEEMAAHPLFSGISSRFLQWNRDAIVRRHFKAREVVCREGEFGSTAFLIEKGKFEVRIRSPLSHVKKERKGIFGLFGRFATGLARRDKDTREEEGDAQFIYADAPVSLEYGDPVAVLTPEDVIFGEMTCMSHYPRAATVTAIEDGTVVEILRNVLYMLQRNSKSKALLDAVYRNRALESHLRGVKVFAQLVRDPAEFGRFVEFLRPRVQLVRVHPGQVVFRQGDLADHFYMVRVGFIKVSQQRPGGEQVLNYIGPGGYFGEIGLMNMSAELQLAAPSGVRVATCSALDHVQPGPRRGKRFSGTLAEVS